jgi:transcriptional regulator with XRE-family HTH domain
MEMYNYGEVLIVLGNRLRELRIEKGLTQEELGELINLTKANISKYESGKLEPNIDTINYLSNFFDVSVDYLFGRTTVRNFYVDRQDEILKIIHSVVLTDKELTDFWTEFPHRIELQVLLKQIKDLKPEAIHRLIKYINMVEKEKIQGES